MQLRSGVAVIVCRPAGARPIHTPGLKLITAKKGKEKKKEKKKRKEKEHTDPKDRGWGVR